MSFKALSCLGPLFPELLRHRCDFPLFFCVVLLISLFINCKRGCFHSLPCSLPETKDKATTLIMMFESQHPVYNWSMGSLSVFLLNRWKNLGADPVSGKIRAFSLRNICFRNPTAIYRLGARCRVRAGWFFIYLMIFFVKPLCSFSRNAAFQILSCWTKLKHFLLIALGKVVRSNH